MQVKHFFFIFLPLLELICGARVRACVVVNATRSGFDFHSRKWNIKYFHFFKNLNTRLSHRIGFTFHPSYMRDTAWRWKKNKKNVPLNITIRWVLTTSKFIVSYICISISISMIEMLFSCFAAFYKYRMSAFPQVTRLPLTNIIRFTYVELGWRMQVSNKEVPRVF